MFKLSTYLLTTGVLLCQVLWAQRAVSPQQRYERLVCIVPMVGTGTLEDPRRPMFMPSGIGEPSPFLSVSYLAGDNGDFALAEFVAAERAAFREIVTATDGRVKCFEKGKARRADIDGEFRKHRKNFDLQNFGGIAQ